ncbi:nuclear receptor-binding factor 2-like [Cimex lectularius]|uniref:Nuclear receptor-binding factor 2 MIT domain-containing protein n=1 Tax=Cimex lectularius TaxID=79782 RepID=A0A8I6R9T7_CIMLE|nr:nuclear receptor-binding factor 2-like [Cimex lectularius]
MDNNSPLYLAHQNGRNADNHMKLRQYDAAVACHVKASEWLSQAMNLTKYSKALESLQLQYQYHLKQTDLINAKKLRQEIQRELLELKKRKRMEKRSLSVIEQKDQELQMAILKTIEEADSLLGMLRPKADSDDGEDKVQESSTSFMKHPKDEKMVMEELKTVNAQLRLLINDLISQLDASRREVESLKTRLKLYETEAIPDLAPLEMPHFDYSTL